MPYWFRIAFPQAITLSGIFCGMLAILWAPMRPYWACTAIIVAALCDTVDGRIARVLKASSDFGAELDSLSDFVCFGVAPAVVLYLWTLEAGGGAGQAPAFSPAVAGDLLAARSERLGQRREGVRGRMVPVHQDRERAASDERERAAPLAAPEARDRALLER